MIIDNDLIARILNKLVIFAVILISTYMKNELTIEHIGRRIAYKPIGQYLLSNVINLSAGQKDEFRRVELNPENCVFFLRYCNLFLRTLSDLTKPITHKVFINF